MMYLTKIAPARLALFGLHKPSGRTMVALTGVMSDDLREQPLLHMTEQAPLSSGRL
ncbi:uncharacterized protein CMC5_024090 [Chondromyces crocatus]|uniref:Uncharacterized protein n=1 Tax=Chondromyces crocatus TaxID=52 RepID=A0A0K1EBK5_CHOCO|nr:uncharacterized protein CMC5_024090 [Chondromyces crocatus]